MSDRIQHHIAALQADKDPDVRRQAAEELAEHGASDVIKVLAAALADTNKGVRDAASHSLATIGGAEVARAIVHYLAHENIVLRNLAAELLYRLGTDSIQALEPGLRSQDHDVRKMAVDILGLLRHKDAATAIMPLLYDSDPNVVVSAVEALGGIGNESAVPHLIQVFEQEPYTRAIVAESLGKIGGSASSEFLCTSFQKAIAVGNEDPLTIFGIIEALGLIGDPAAFALLSNHLPEVKGKLRRTMLSAIVWIADKSGLPLDIPGASTHDLIDLLGDSDLRVRLNAVRALSPLTDKVVTQAFFNALGSSDYFDVVLLGLLECREDAFPFLLEKLSDDNCKNKRQLVVLVRTMLQNNAGQGGLGFDQSMIDNAFALTEQQWESADEETRAAIVETLFALNGDRALAMLDTLMNDPDPWLRMRVIELLGTLADERLPGFLSRYLKDEDEMVRNTAEWVLESKGYSFDANQNV